MFKLIFLNFLGGCIRKMGRVYIRYEIKNQVLTMASTHVNPFPVEPLIKEIKTFARNSNFDDNFARLLLYTNYVWRNAKESDILQQVRFSKDKEIVFVDKKVLKMLHNILNNFFRTDQEIQISLCDIFFKNNFFKDGSNYKVYADPAEIFIIQNNVDYFQNIFDSLKYRFDEETQNLLKNKNIILSGGVPASLIEFIGAKLVAFAMESNLSTSE
ncbi:hypothetical protein G9O61_00g014370 [Vairimorpha ceranae]|nr:hypothetical protein G9O61_00g021910 [Vairimorpha ceranae]KAF5140421.1 hypothetical protein G9O61_00g014370 [Vairimorpha ceranae]